MLKKIKSFLPHKIEDQFHYGDFKGSFNFLRQLSWNICHPYRLINRFRWLNFFKSNNSKKREFKQELSKFKLNDEYLFSNELLEDKFNYYIENGGVLLENFFPKSLIEQFYFDYKEIINQMRKLTEDDKKLQVIYKVKVLNLTENLMKLWLDDRLTLFMKKSLNGNVFAREYPILYYTKNNGFDVSSKEIEKKQSKNKVKAPTGWHIDHTAGLTNLHILLEDIDENSTHMEFLPGSHKYMNMTDGYSDETIQNFKTKPVKCIGKKGTVYFHNSNTLHRVVSSSYKDRLSLIFSFSPGNGISINSKHISIALSTDYNLDIMNKGKRQILSALFPLTRFVEIKNQNITSAKFSGK